MTLPLSTTTITVLRPADGDPYVASVQAPTVVATVPAHISSPSGTSQIIGGEQSTVELRLICEGCDLRHTDLVKDNATDAVYSVSWVTIRRGLGLDHVSAGLRFTEGAA
jgi:hypothetical protein